MTKYHRFGVDDYRVESQETAFQGFFRITRMVVSHRLFGGGWSAPLKRELFQRGDAVGVLLYDPKHHTVGLVEQFRVGAMQDQQGPWQYEVVAGMIEPGESPADVATRECQEEAGIQVENLIPICDYLVSAGGSDEKMHMYCGIADLKGREGVFGLETEGEDILLQVWPYDEVMQAQSEGLLNSAAVTIALLWLQLNQEKLRSSA
ncbi:MAG: NUDIX domain-containing protein [Porticoccaceae bacterium]|nr:NUDIX domain-containing protein [Porticoccaceae bacterium]MDG1306554.1 NUDIX domain-containing protein [Porticoccaceae bacterium]